MSKPEITDEMADRAGRAWFGDGVDKHPLQAYEPEFHRSRMQAALEAALNPPAETRIPVSEMMEKKGMEVLRQCRDSLVAIGDDFIARNVYRAMEFARRREERTVPVADYQHRRVADMEWPGVLHRRSSDPRRGDDIAHAHRRAGDPR